VVALLAVAGPLRAEQPRVIIRSAQVGLPSAHGGAPICKFAAWAPIDVELELLSEVREPAQLVIETPDCDGIATSLAIPLGLAALHPGTTIRPLAYVRPAAGSGETTLVVRRANGAALSEPYRIRSLQPRDSLSYVILSLGSNLPGFDLPKPATGSGADTETATGSFRGGRVELTAITDAGRLPDRWFAYDTADLVVLSTTSADFVKQLFANETKAAALREWVSRGGRLAIAMGSNTTAVQQFPALAELLPFSVPASRQAALLPLYWAARETSQTSTLTGNLAVKSGTFPVATFVARPGRSGRVVIPPANRATESKDIIAVQAGYGLGRVTAIGFDLDRSPFTEFDRQAEFWDWVLRECGASRASVGSEGKPRIPNAAPGDDENEVAAALRTHIDTFEDVPVVSFSSVAFLIALYILLIAPMEYYLLRRVFGRLEFTWITFPSIVLAVCIAASLSASAMKGRDVRVNKVDVVDVVDGSSGRVYGTSWFTVFSPKIDTYSIRVSPAENGEPGSPIDGSLVSWFGSPRAGRASLLRRNYDYHSDAGASADGLDNVPVQTWSTKSFTANWAGTIVAAASASLVESRLEHPPGDPAKAIGTFFNRLPFEAVDDCVAFYAGQAFPLGTIVNGQEVRLVLDRGPPASQWLQERGQLAELLARSQALGAASTGTSRGSASPSALPSSSSLPLWGLLFHEASLRNDEGVVPRNASLRRLDQSWRLTADNRSEVIVVGRVLPAPGTIDAVFGGSESPSRLRLKGDQPVSGFARQETYVRLYLPVKDLASGGR
jgi:hypothetical protein